MTEQPKYTRERIPILTKDISDVFARDLALGRVKDTELIARINAENPLIAQYIGIFVENLRRRGLDLTAAREVAKGLIYQYEMLRRQGEAYRLEDSVNGTSSPK